MKRRKIKEENVKKKDLSNDKGEKRSNMRIEKE